MNSRSLRRRTTRRLGGAAIGAGLVAAAIQTVVHEKEIQDAGQNKAKLKRVSAHGNKTDLAEPGFGTQRESSTYHPEEAPRSPRADKNSPRQPNRGNVGKRARLSRPAEDSEPVERAKDLMTRAPEPPQQGAVELDDAGRANDSRAVASANLHAIAEPEAVKQSVLEPVAIQVAEEEDPPLQAQVPNLALSYEISGFETWPSAAATLSFAPEPVPEASPSQINQASEAADRPLLLDRPQETTEGENSAPVGMPPPTPEDSHPKAGNSYRADEHSAGDAPLPAASLTQASDSLPRPAFGLAPHVSEAERAPQLTSEISGFEIQEAPRKPVPAGRDQASRSAELQTTIIGRERTSAVNALPKPLFGLPLDSEPSVERQPQAPAITAGLVAAKTNSSSGLSSPRFSADDELILEIATSDGSVGDTIVGYGTRTGVYLPLGEVARLLDLAIVTSDDGNYASGWVLDENSTVQLNLKAGSLTIKGIEQKLAPADAVAYEGELYLRADRFAALMPLTVTVDLRSQTVNIKTLTPFPFEQRAQRETARNKLGSQGRKQIEGPVRENTPWQALSFPVGDLEVRGVSDTAFGSRGEVDLRLASDLAFMTARAFANGNTRDGLVAARLEMGRRDPDAGLLGPFHATQFKVGDIATTALPLGLRGIAGLGAQITNAPLGQTSVFDRVDLRGELPDGYEAELYRNNTLVGSTRQPVNGQYQFLQVPVEFGLNVFRIVLYGPQGQRREEVRRLTVGDGRIGKGVFQYDFGLARKDGSLIDARGPDFSPGEDYNAWRLAGSLQYGISTSLTASLSGGLFESRGGRHWLIGTGLRTGIAGTAVRIDAGLRKGGGRAFGIQLSGRTAGVNWTASHFEYSGEFADEVRAFTMDPLRRASEMDFSTVVQLTDTGLPITGRIRRLVFADGRVETNAGARSSLLLGQTLASNSVFLRQFSTVSAGGRTFIGGTLDLASVGRSKTQLRAAIDYALKPAAEVVSVRVAADRYFNDDNSLSISAGHVFAGSATTLGMTFARRFQKYSLGLDGTLNFPERSYSVGLRLGLSFGRNPIDRALFTTRSSMASNGSAAFRVFADANRNGTFDFGEAPLAGVSLSGGGKTVVTNGEGMALVEGLGDGQRIAIQLDETTLPDVDMAAQKPGIEIVARAGRVHASSFGVVELGEVSGIAVLGEQRKGISGLLVELVDANGVHLARARTSTGGVFSFERIRPGLYELALNAQQAAKLGIVLKAGARLELLSPSTITRTVLVVKKSE